MISSAKGGSFIGFLKRRRSTEAVEISNGAVSGFSLSLITIQFPVVHDCPEILFERQWTSPVKTLPFTATKCHSYFLGSSGLFPVSCQ